MKKGKQFAALFLTLAMASGLAVHAGAESEEGRYDSIVVGLSAEINSLNPDDPNSGCKPLVGWEIYESLFDIDGFGGEMYGVLAKSYTVVDELHYTVELYDYITDSEGNKIDANDVVYSYQYSLDSGANTVLLTYVDSITALDDYTVEFTWLTEPTPVGDLEAMFAKVWVFSQAAFEASTDSFATDPVATGPYVVTNFTAGSSVTLEANDNYWQTDESLVYPQHERNVQTIRFDTISESAQMVTALKTGAIDYADGIAYSSLTDFQEGGSYADSYSIDSYQDNQVYMITPNCSENSALADINLRLALYYAVDTSQLCAAIPSDTVELFTFCNSNYSEYVESLAEQDNYITSCDPELAQQYLEAAKEAGYDGSPLKMLLTTDETLQNVGQILQILWLQNLGIEVEFLTYDSATVKEYKEYDDMWDLILEGRGSTDYAVTYLKGMFDTTASHTSMWVSDDELQTLITTLESVDGHTEENYTAFHDYVVSQAYEMPLYSLYKYGVYTADMTSLCKTAKNYILPGGCTYVAN